MIGARTLPLIALAVIAGPELAQAQQGPGPFGPLQQACNRYVARDLPPSEVLTALLQANTVPWSPGVIDAYQVTISGLNAEGRTLADSQAFSSHYDNVRQNLTQMAEWNAAGGPPSQEITSTVRNPGVDYSETAHAYLRGDFGAMTIHCPSPVQRVDGPQDQTGSGSGQDPDRGVILAGDVASLTQSAMGSRSFATLSYVDNAETGAESIEADLVLGFGEFRRGAVSWVPYVAYERRTSAASPLNDLSFGVTGSWAADYHLVRWTIDFETDDDFESEVYRAELEWRPPSFGLCARVRFPARMVCRYGLRADYADVADPGDKASLLQVDEYFRVGGWLDASYGRPLGPGWIEARIGYELMEPLTDDVGDAAIGRASLVFSPSPTSHFSFGLTYENGEDITSLVRSEVLKATFGLRY